MSDLSRASGTAGTARHSGPCAGFLRAWPDYYLFLPGRQGFTDATNEPEHGSLGETGIEGLRLLNQGRLGLWRKPPPAFGFLPALLIRRTLACGNLVEGAPLRLHPHVRLPREHHLVAGQRRATPNEWVRLKGIGAQTIG